MKKFFLFPVIALLALVLSACGGSGSEALPGADELLSGGALVDGVSAELSVRMSVGVSLTQEELGVGDKDAAGMEWPVEMSVTADIAAVDTADASHTSGDLSVSFLDTVQDMTLDNWTEHLDGGKCVSYDYNAYDGVWVRYEGPEFDDLTSNAAMLSVDAGVLEDASVAMDGGDYVLTGRVPVSAVAGDSVLGFGEDISGGFLPEDGAFDVRMAFDGETRALKSVRFNLDGDAGAGLTSFDVTVDVVRTGFDAVSVPAEVEANAVDSADMNAAPDGE